MHSSIFSYNVSRAYPFKWFTPIVIVGGLLATVLFSFINFASNGYSLNVVYATNPNTTVTEGIWFKHWPSFLTSKVLPTCQSADIPVNTQFFTNQTGLTYTLTNVWQPFARATSSNQSVTSSLTYYNNPLQSCVINSVEVDLEALDRSAAQIAWAEWGANVRAYITCGFTSSTGYMLLNITSEYDYVPQTVSFASGLTTLISRDKQQRASLYWGESLLSMYWAFLTRTMQDIRVNDTSNGEVGIRKGTIYFTPNNASITDITDLDYFDIDYRFIQDQGLGSFNVIFPGDNDFVTTISNLNQHNAHPNIWIPADSLAKSFYSTILTDLGQTSTSYPNILLDPITLQHFTTNFSYMLQHIANAHPGPATLDFNTLKSTTGPLGTTPSVIFTKYLCQIPERKSFGALFVAILVADLVFLQASWQLFKWTVELTCLRESKVGYGINFCEGCVKAQAMEQRGMITYPSSKGPSSTGYNINPIDSRQSLIVE